jgi:hypothetical protein
MKTSIIALAAACATLAAAPAAQDLAVECRGTRSGTVAALLVPAGVTCTAANLLVTGDVTVEPGATLSSVFPATCDAESGGSFTVGGRITVGKGAALVVVTTALNIGEEVVAEGARAVTLVATPCAGATGNLDGDVRLDRTESVTVLGLRIGGSVVAHPAVTDPVPAVAAAEAA